MHGLSSTTGDVGIATGMVVNLSTMLQNNQHKYHANLRTEFTKVLE